MFGIQIEQLFSKDRMERLTNARHVARYISYEYQMESIPSIARFERRTNASVTNSLKCMRGWIDDPRTNPEVVEKMNIALNALGFE